MDAAQDDTQDDGFNRVTRELKAMYLYKGTMLRLNAMYIKRADEAGARGDAAEERRWVNKTVELSRKEPPYNDVGAIDRARAELNDEIAQLRSEDDMANDEEPAGDAGLEDGNG